ncbi:MULTISPECIES: hypothetical protein [Arsenicicoccus]|uniref:hypothetical protein n=1 Tax=Arsenicicoccus TaxID=267408 RepID=UPI00257C14CD|nr:MULTISPECIES: hypothetical protein [Arsenicicoccus]
MSSSTSTSAARPGKGRHKAGAFDIRNFIGYLLGLYGLVLTLMGLFGDKELDKTGGVNANLWTGLALLVVACCFMAWARLRPIVVPDYVDTDDAEDTGRPAGH